jgi:hypothetical protein
MKIAHLQIYMISGFATYQRRWSAKHYFRFLLYHFFGYCVSPPMAAFDIDSSFLILRKRRIQVRQLKLWTFLSLLSQRLPF